MNILLINVPSRRGIEGFALPLGLLYVGTIIERCGHKAKIVDLYLDDLELKGLDEGNLENIDKLIADYKPSIIGYGGIATSYGRTKRLCLHIKSRYPEIVQVAGGPLASVYELLLTKAKVDTVFHGETEVSLPIFLERIEQKASVHNTPGTSYLLNEKVVRNAPPEQIKDLDIIPFPAYHLVDLPKYLISIEDWSDHYQISGQCPESGGKRNWHVLPYRKTN